MGEVRIYMLIKAVKAIAIYGFGVQEEVDIHFYSNPCLYTISLRHLHVYSAWKPLVNEAVVMCVIFLKHSFVLSFRFWGSFAFLFGLVGCLIIIDAQR